jgi:hypothetical protein
MKKDGIQTRKRKQKGSSQSGKLSKTVKSESSIPSNFQSIQQVKPQKSKNW